MIERARVLAAPEPGYFVVRLVKGGPLVPAQIFRRAAIDPATGEGLDRSPVLLVQIGLAEPSADPADIERAWLGEPADRTEYEYLMRVARWARDHAPGSPEANARAAIDLSRLPPVF